MYNGNHSFRTLDLGSYCCQVSQRCRNGSFITLSSCTTLVQLQPYEPLIVTQPENRSVFAGDRLELSCEVDSYPAADFLWHKDDIALEGQNSSTLMVWYSTYLNPVLSCINSLFYSF